MAIDKERNEQNRRLLYSLTDKLKERGFRIAENTTGKRIEYPEPSLGKYTNIGILSPPRFKIIKFPVPFVKAHFPGTLWIDNEIRYAEPDKHWVLDVFGKEYANHVKNLFEELAKPYGVSIETKIIIDQIRFEDQELEFPGITTKYI